MPYFDEDPEEEFPFPENTPTIPDNKAKELAYYASNAIAKRNPIAIHQETALEDAKEYHAGLYKNIYTDLSTTGRSQVLNNEYSQLAEENDLKNKNTLLSLYADPSINKETKIQSTRYYLNNRKRPFDFRNNFAIESLSEDTSFIEQDRKAHEDLITKLDSSVQAMVDTQNLIDRAASTLPAIESTGAGMKEIGKAVALDALFPMSSGMRLASIDGSINQTTKLQKLGKAILEGSNLRDLSTKFNTLSNEERKIFAQTVLDKIKDVPTTNWHEYELIKGIFDNPEMKWWETGLLNLGSMLDTVAAGAILKHPLRATEAFLSWMKPELGGTFEKLLGINISKRTAGADVFGPRIDPIFGSKFDPRNPNIPTGVLGKELLAKPKPSPEDIRVAKARDITPREEDVNLYQLSVKPTVGAYSPQGILDKTNPQKASESRLDTLMDDTNNLADSLGTTKAQVVADTLPKNMHIIGDIKPDIAERLRQLDGWLNDDFEYNKLDPFLYSREKRLTETSRMFDVLQNQGIAYYQQANSLFYETGNKLFGTAIYGKNSLYGYTNKEEALSTLETMQKSLNQDFIKKAEIVQQGDRGHWYIKVDYQKDFDIDDYLLKGNGGYDIDLYGTKLYTVPFSEKNIDITKFSRGDKAGWLINSLNRLPRPSVQGAMAAETREDKVIGTIASIMNNVILPIKARKELNKELTLVLENEKWKSYPELLKDNAHLSKNAFDEMYESYVTSELLSNHLYRWSNSIDYHTRITQGQKAIYDENGKLYQYAIPIKDEKDLKYVWDVEDNKPIVLKRDEVGTPVLNGKTLVKLTKDITKNWAEIKAISHRFQDGTSDVNIFKYALIGSKYKIEELPHVTLPKIEGYIHRHNIGPYFVVQSPKSARMNGKLYTNPLELQENFSKKVGAERSSKRAELLKQKLMEENPNANYEVVLGKETTVTDMAEVYKMNSDTLKFGKQRGERLRTLDDNTKSILESPTEAMMRSARSIVRMGVWKDYNEAIEKKFVERFNDLIAPESRGRMPNTMSGLIRPSGNLATESNLAKYEAALRELEYHQNLKYQLLPSDAVAANIINNGADIIEKVGQEALANYVRKQAKRGNPVVRIPNSIASTLQLYLNPVRQWQVQTQQQWNFVVMDPAHVHNGVPLLMPMLLAISSRAKAFRGYENEIYEIAKALGTNPLYSSVDAKEFDDIFKGIYSSGLPESVDLNMMLHGVIHNNNYELDPSMWAKLAEISTQIITTPGKIGKAIGYTPAELSNTIGAYIFARNQFKKSNPGVAIDNPHHWEIFKTQGWELTGSMSTKADAMNYQQGAWAFLFKYKAIQAKQMALMTSSKLLNKSQRGRLIASNLFWFGVNGMIGGAAVDYLVNEYASPETKAEFNKYKGAVVDLMFNQGVATIYESIMGEALEKTPSLDISGSLGPLSSGSGIPPVDVVMDMLNLFWIKDKTKETDLAAIAAMGTVGKFFNDVYRNFRTQEYDTPEAIQMVLGEYAELSRGFTNAEHAYYMYKFGEAVNREGMPTGVRASFIDSFGRIFGNRMKEELAIWDGFKVQQAENIVIQKRSKEIFNNIIKYNVDVDSPEYVDTATRMSKLLSIEPDHIKHQIWTEVEKNLRRHAKSPSQKENFINNYFQKEAAGNSEAIGRLKAYLGVSTDPNDKILLDRLNTNVEEGTK